MTPNRRRWLRRFLFAVILTGALFLAHKPLLSGLAGFLVIDNCSKDPDAVLLLDGDQMYKRAALQYHAGVTRLLLIEGPPSRLERMKILPDRIEMARRELTKHDVPESAIDVLKMEKPGDWNRARRLRDWLIDHPEEHVCVLCDRFTSRRTRCLFDQTLGPLSARVSWRALPQRSYDETNWYHGKVGTLALFDSYLGWAHVRIYGEAEGEREEWDPDTYQNNLR